MPLTFDMAIEYGRMTIREQHKNEEKPRDYVVKIVHGNCLAVWIYETPKEYQLYFFLADKEHGKRIMKGNNNRLLGTDDVRDIRLNLYYKEARELCYLMAMSGYEVKCYYEEPKKEANNVRK